MVASTGAAALIGIPTFRRPQMLSRLMQSLEPSLRSGSAAIAVADNDCSSEVEAQVAAFRQRWPETIYIPVGERGISANRNALITAFVDHPGRPPYLGMLDDDLEAPPNWLESMASVATQTGADAVGGPYSAKVEQANIFVRNSTLVAHEIRPAGPTHPFYTGGNFLIGRQILERNASLRFNPDYGLSGGEDYDFFKRVQRLGGTFAWCPEAFCEENIDEDRLTARYVLYRYFSSGTYMSRIDRTSAPAIELLAGDGLFFSKTALKLAIAVAGLDSNKAAGSLLMLALAFGRIVGASGVKTHRYR